MNSFGHPANLALKNHCSVRRTLSIPGAVEIKKQEQNSTNGSTKPKTQWFCVHVCTIFHLNTNKQNEVPLFFDVYRVV